MTTIDKFENEMDIFNKEPKDGFEIKLFKFIEQKKNKIWNDI